MKNPGAAKRIRFLADRRVIGGPGSPFICILRSRTRAPSSIAFTRCTVSGFRLGILMKGEKFDPKVLPNSYLTDPQPGHAFVYVSTIQRMTINLFGSGGTFGDEEEKDDEASQIEIPNHAFDVIIADECHRGYTAQQVAVWRDTLDHFDAIKIGLTATPAAHTTTYFRDVVYRYEYDGWAVREGYLVDYDAVTIRSNIRMGGAFLKEGELVGVVDTSTGAEQMDYLEDERQYQTSDIEARVTVPDSNRKILQELKKYTDEHEATYGRFPKTLIFAANDLQHTSHADQLVETARTIFGRGEAFATKITGMVDRPLQRIREFRNRPQPCIAVTVDLLSTGVDIPDPSLSSFFGRLSPEYYLSRCSAGAQGRVLPIRINRISPCSIVSMVLCSTTSGIRHP